LERAGIPKATIGALGDAYRILFRLPMKRGAALAKARAEFPGVAEVGRLVEFVGAPSKRGTCRHGRE
jgi:acyl-[acyl carrier protein]--UDP-N-acetylglucosamine O-acyltransferase